MDVVNVPSVLLLQSVSYPAAFRVPLLAGLFIQRDSLQRHTGTLNTTVLLKRALIKLQALGTRGVVVPAVRAAAGTVLTQQWLVAFVTYAPVALAVATATALYQTCIQTARSGLLTLAGRALVILLAITFATGAGTPI